MLQFKGFFKHNEIVNESLESLNQSVRMMFRLNECSSLQESIAAFSYETLLLLSDLFLEAKAEKRRYASGHEMELGSELARHELQQQYQSAVVPKQIWMNLAQAHANELSQQGGPVTWGQALSDMSPKKFSPQVKHALQSMGLNVPDAAITAARNQLIKISQLPPEQQKAAIYAPPGNWRHGMARHLRGTMKQQEPIIQAWKEIGLDATPEQIHDYLKKNGVKILPGEQYVKYAVIDILRGVRDKIQEGEALNPKEKQLYDAWQKRAELARDFLVNSYQQQIAQTHEPQEKERLQGLLDRIQSAKVDPFSKGGLAPGVGPEDIYDYLKKQNALPLSRNDVEVQLINKIKHDIESGIEFYEDPKTKTKSSERRFDRALDVWLGQGSKYYNSKQKGVSHYLSGEIKKMPKPYLSIRSHESMAKPDPEVLAKYKDENGQWNDLYREQIVKPACLTVNRMVISYIKKYVGITPPGIEMNWDDTSPDKICGVKPSHMDDPFRHNFLAGGNQAEIVARVIKGMEDSTGLPGWMDNEGTRYARAKWLTLHEFQKIYRKQYKGGGGKKTKSVSLAEPEAISGGGGGGGGEEMEEIPTDIVQNIIDNPAKMKELEQAVDAIEDPMEKDRLQDFINRIKKAVAEKGVEV